jgi:hypothetical protein
MVTDCPFMKGLDDPVTVMVATPPDQLAAVIAVGVDGVYWAVMALAPNVTTLLVVKLATPVAPDPAVTVTGEPSGVPLSKNWTVPVGKALPDFGVIVSVKTVLVAGFCGDTGEAVTTLDVSTEPGIKVPEKVRLSNRQLPELLLYNRVPLPAADA